MTGKPAEAWSSGAAYEAFIGRWSRPVAVEFLDWLAVGPGSVWLDVGCGTGALTQAVLSRTDPKRVVGVDFSPAFVSHAVAAVTDRRAEFRVGDAQHLDDEDDAFEAVVSGLALNFVPDPGRAVAELRRVTRPGGVVAAYVWDYVEGGMQLLHEFWAAAVAVDPAAAPLTEGVRFPLCTAERLGALFRDAGLASVETTAITVPTVFGDFDDCWSPFLGGQGPALTYLQTLDEGGRERVRAELARRLPAQPDGSIRLTARAWAVRGVAP